MNHPSLWRYLQLAVVCLMILRSGMGRAAPAVRPADLPVQEVPFGVYWPWERTGGIARNAGLEQWDFVKGTCQMLRKSGVDTVWLVNIGLEDLKKLLKITRPLGLRLLPCLGEIEPHNLGGTAGTSPEKADFLEKARSYYEKTIPQVVQAVGEDRAGVLAWVLCDEPTGKLLSLMEPMRQMFARADPDRPALAVTMWGQTPEAIKTTRLTTFCVDLYPFFGPGNPNGPHTPEASKNFYSFNIQRMVEEAGRDGRVGWVMPQCFNEIWGPWEIRSSGIAVALPQSFIHWRTPTLGEIRWQIWEGLRAGAKGIIFFVLLGPDQGNPKARPVSDAALKPILVEKATSVGYPALLDHKGRPTYQFNLMTAIFRRLIPHKLVILRLTPTSAEWLTPGKDARVGHFIDPRTQQRYAVVVNSDMAEAHIIEVIVGPGAHAVADVLQGEPLEMKSLGWTGGGFRIHLPLHAGEGALLKIIY